MPDRRAPSREAGYEVSGADIRRLWLIGGGLLLMLAAVLGGLVVVERLELPDRGRARFEPAPPPAPRLQTAPMQDLQAFRRAETEALTTYGWVDRAAGVARIPVDAAMAIIAERGLPDFGGGEGDSGPMAGAAARPVPRGGVERQDLQQPGRAVDPVQERGPAPVDEPTPATGERQLPDAAQEIPAKARPVERRIIDLQDGGAQ